MATPVVNSVGDIAFGNGITVNPGASHTVDDIDVTLLETVDSSVISLATPNGFAEVTALNQVIAGATQMSVWWRRWNGTDGSPVFASADNHQIARMISISGCITSGDPWDIVLTGITDSVADTSVEIIGGTTTVAECLILAMVVQELPDANSTAQFTSWANADLSSVTEQMDNARNVGNGGAVGMATGEKATAGLFGTTTATAATSSRRVGGMLALKPPAVAGPRPHLHIPQKLQPVRFRP